MRLTLIVIMLFGIGLTLDIISQRLAGIQKQLTIANCLTEAKVGRRCTELDR